MSCSLKQKSVIYNNEIIIFNKQKVGKKHKQHLLLFIVPQNQNM